MAHDDAAQFLARVVPWPLAGQEPPEFFVNIHAPMRWPDRDKPTWGGRACTTLREALSFIDFVKRRKAEQAEDDWPKYTGDLFTCMSAQRMAKGKVAKNGRPYYTAVRSSLNCLWHKSFYIDVDSKKEYHGSPDATRRAFALFIQKIGLPFPTFIVASGSPGNFQAHWVIDERIETERWLPLAQALVAAMRAHGFKVDYTVTTTPERVLRVPDTFNWKTDPPNPVTLRHSADSMVSLAAIERVLEPYKGMAAPAPVRRSSTNGSSYSLPADFGTVSTKAGPVQELVPNQSEGLPRLVDLAKCCPLVHRACRTGGAEFSEPLWFETVKLAYYLKEGEAAAHVMSEGYDGYSYEETHQKFEIERSKRWPVDNWGWPTCRQIREAGSEDCNACPHMISGEAEGRHPFNFVGRDWQAAFIVNGSVTVAAPQVPTIPVNPDEPLVPPGYMPRGYLFFREASDADADDNGVKPPPKLAMPFPTRNYMLSEDHWLMFDYFLNNRWSPAIIECASLSDVRSFSHAVGKQAGFAFKSSMAQEARDLMVSFVEMLRERADRIIPTDANGWSIMDGKEVAWTYGKLRRNCADGGKGTPSYLPDKDMQESFSPTGHIEPCLRAIKIMHNQGRPVLDATMAASMGTPLMYQTGQRGVIMALRSYDTARGKSSVIRTSQSFWGSPDKILALDSTSNSVDIQLGMLRHLPVFWDEVGDTDNTKTFMNTLFKVSQGKTKSRAHRSGMKLQETRTWACIMFVGTNYSLQKSAEAMGSRSEAGISRMWEHRVPERSADTYVENFDGIMHELDNNYGHVGAAISRWLGENASSISDRVQSFQVNLRKEFGAEDSDRFKIALATCTLMGAWIGNKVGVSAFDIERLHAYLKNEFEQSKKERRDKPIGVNKAPFQVELLAGFINDPKTIKIRTNIFGAKQRGNPASVTIVGTPPEERFAKALMMQIAVESRKVRISRKAFFDHMKIAQPNLDRGIIDEMISTLGAQIVRATLGSGSKHFSGQAQEYLLELDLTRPELQQLFSED